MNRWLEGFYCLLFPQRTLCHACSAPLRKTEELLCEHCAASLETCLLTAGRAETVLGAEVYCAVSVYRYQEVAATLVKALKFGSDRTAAIPLAQAMAQTIATVPALQLAELCVPVPVHYRRMRRRGYNQAAVLAAGLEELQGLPMASDALVRVHHKHSQVGQGREARRENIAGAFAVSSVGEQIIAGRYVLLLDDVLTTGATALECARVLLDAGARQVCLLTVCRA